MIWNHKCSLLQSYNNEAWRLWIFSIYIDSRKNASLVKLFSFVCMQFWDISISYFIDTGKSIIWFKHYNYVLICIRKSTKGSNRTERVLFFMYVWTSNFSLTKCSSYSSSFTCYKIRLWETSIQLPTIVCFNIIPLFSVLS